MPKITHNSSRITHHFKNWLGRKDSNLRMPDPKTGALPLGDAPARAPAYCRLLFQEARPLGRAGIVSEPLLTRGLLTPWYRRFVIAAPYASTGKDAPTSFEFDRLNGASLRVFAIKNSKHRRAAARE